MFDTKIEDFSIINVLGRGALGTVYEVLHKTTGKRSAIKRVAKRYLRTDPVGEKLETSANQRKKPKFKSTFQITS
jgi:serine/threonine protein kinase